jgi:protein-L-isoaspartate O-methyltransferase
MCRASVYHLVIQRYTCFLLGAQVMLRLDRGNYAPNFAYDDSPQYLGYEQTISAPHMHAHALELLKERLVPGATVSESPAFTEQRPRARGL